LKYQDSKYIFDAYDKFSYDRFADIWIFEILETSWIKTD